MPVLSKASPIRVDFLTADDVPLPGRIGLTIAPGKRDGWSGANRDLDGDLSRLRDYYQASTLVSLMEDFEYRDLGIGDLFERAGQAGLTVRPFPIRDVGAPPPHAMPHFFELVRAILDDVRAGKTVVIHCRGGLGRSGLVAASCLTALGRDPDDAIARVRAARMGAIETPEQEDWVRRVFEALNGVSN